MPDWGNDNGRRFIETDRVRDIWREFHDTFFMSHDHRGPQVSVGAGGRICWRWGGGVSILSFYM